MALKQATAAAMPDLACIGNIKSVGEANRKEGKEHYSFPVEIEGKHGGRGTKFYFWFKPEWFSNDFDPESLEGQAKRNYRQQIASSNERRPGLIQIICNDDFDELAEVFSNLATVDADTITDVLRTQWVGRDVGYILQQREDENDDGTKEKTEYYEARRFFPVTDEALDRVVREAANENRRRGELIVTWDE